MAMQLLESPTYIKKKELKKDTFAFECLKYRSSAENLKSKYPGSPGAINHTFEDETGKRFVISGDTVMNRKLEEDVWAGRNVGLFYKGKFDDNGEEVNYHNWQLALDNEEINPNQPASKPANITPDTTSDSLDSLE